MSSAKWRPFCVGHYVLTFCLRCCWSSCCVGSVMARISSVSTWVWRNSAGRFWRTLWPYVPNWRNIRWFTATMTSLTSRRTLEHRSGSKLGQVNSLTPGRFKWNFWWVQFQAHFSNWWLRYLQSVVFPSRMDHPSHRFYRSDRRTNEALTYFMSWADEIYSVGPMKQNHCVTDFIYCKIALGWLPLDHICNKSA